MTALPSIALVQMRVLAGHPGRNVERMLAHLDTARAGGAEVVVFSEMCVAGYLLGDHWEVDAVAADFAAWSESIRAASAGLTVLFGNVAIDTTRINEDGRIRKYNAVHVCHDGRYVERPGLPAPLPPGVAPKMLHPNYRYFDDDRHFYSLRKLAQAEGVDVEALLRPFEVPRAGGGTFRFGVELCEDMWCQDYRVDGRVPNAARVYREAGAEAVFNLSASPWTWMKNDKRNRTVAEMLADGARLPFFYVNQIGAQNNGKNILVFDGDTTAYDAGGKVVARAAPWRESVLFPASGEVHPRQDEQAAYLDGAIEGLRHVDEMRGAPSRFLLGVSGGIDSAVVACLLNEAFGPERVFGVNMPTRFNADVTRANARRLCEGLGIDFLECPIEDVYAFLARKIGAAGFPRAPGEYTRLVDENIQARIRGADVLAGLAAKCGLVFTNNGNKSEVALGYATLYGDVNGAIAPIADLYKTHVFALARHLNENVYGREMVPANLYDGTVVPSAELSEAQDVTRGLGDPIRYDYHDRVLREFIEMRRHPLDLLGWYAEGEFTGRIGFADQDRFLAWFPDTRAFVDDLEWVARQVRVNVFKRIQAPPIVVLTKRAFGFDLRESQIQAYWPRAYLELKRRLGAG